MPRILHRIRDLGVYEHEPDAVINTGELLHGVLLAERPGVFAHVVERDAVVVGDGTWKVTYLVAEKAGTCA